MDIDYTRYSVDQLLDVKQHIDPEVAPENYRRLLEELDKRSEEIAALKLAAEKKPHPFHS